MRRHPVALMLLIAWSVFGQELHLKSRTIRTDAGPTAAPAGVHRIVQFDHSPDVEDIEGLLKDGNTLVSALPDNSVVVSTDGSVSLARSGVRWVSDFDPKDKISKEFSGVDSAAAIVEFHSDVPVEAQDSVANQEGIAWSRMPYMAAHHAVATISSDQREALAAHDEVAYIFPADPDMLNGTTFNTCAGMLTMSGAVAQYANIVHGWDLDADRTVHLGYVFGPITPKVPSATVQHEIVRALTQWSNITNVSFQPATSGSAPRTVYIKFASGAHGDAYPFDGPGGILAHTFYPVPVNPESIAGDMHLDADENWHAGADLDIYTVALHEAGHAIGLGHSDKPGDVMYPYYRSGMQLSANDIGAAQTLYGVPLASPAAVTAPVAITVSAAPALHLSVDASSASTAGSITSLSGGISGGTPPVTVQWQTDHAYGGHATVGGSGWNAQSITLVNGPNNITVTAYDAASHSASQTVAVTRTSQAPAAPVSITLVTPSSNVVTVNTPTLTVSGTSTGTRVTWQTSGGATGTATGTTHWLASGIPLLTGNNTIVLRAYDAQGNSSWAAVAAVRR